MIETQESLNQVYEWILTNFELQKQITEDVIIEDLGEETGQIAILILDFLVSKGHAINIIQNNIYFYEVTNPKLIIDFLDEIKKEVKIIPKTDLVESLVVSFPLSLRTEIDLLTKKYSNNLSILTLNQAIKSIMNAAKKKLYLSVPFLEFDGVMNFYDEFESLAKRKVSVYILSRDILKESNDYSYIHKIRAISKIIEVFKGRSKIEIRDFGSRIGSKVRSLHFEGLHQKMIIADNDICYIGSGEIRAASILMNGEVGYILKNKKANFWTEFFLIFWNNSRKIPINYFDKFIRDD